MVSLGYQPGQMTVLGNSMGAATVIPAAPDLTAVGALVAGSAFADLSSAMGGGLTRYTHLPGVLAMPAIEFSRMFTHNPREYMTQLLSFIDQQLSHAARA